MLAETNETHEIITKYAKENNIVINELSTDEEKLLQIFTHYLTLLEQVNKE